MIPASAAILLTWPFMLWGMGMIVLPVTAHLLYLRHRRRVVFPTLRFLRQALAAESRFFRLRRIVLLLLRCLAVALLTLGFSRPIWTGSLPAGRPSGPPAVVILLDASASMSLEQEGVSVWSRALSEVHASLQGESEPGALFNVIRVDHRPVPAFPQMVSNARVVAEVVNAWKPAQGRADFASALALARLLLADHVGPRRMVFVSDLQATNWESEWVHQLEREPIRWHVTDVGAEHAANTAITDLRVVPDSPVAGRPMRVVATVINHAEHPRTIPLALRLDGQLIGTTRLELEPGKRGEIAFDAAAATPGTHRLTVTTGTDDLAPDDTRYGLLEIQDGLQVLLIAEADPDDPSRDPYYIHRAIAPLGDSDRVRVTHSRRGSLPAGVLQGFDCIVLCEPPEMSDTQLLALQSYVRQGGRLLMFLGNARSATTAGRIEQRAGDGPFLPFLPLTRRSDDLRVAEGNWDAHGLQAIDGAARLALAEVLFSQVFDTTELVPGAMKLFGFDNGALGAAWVARGRGGVMLVNFTPSPTAGDIGKTGMFVVLLHAIVDRLRSGPTADEPLRVGDVLPIQVGEVVRDETGRVMDGLRPLDRSGFYERKTGEDLDWSAVNLDDRESDPRKIAQPPVFQPGDDRKSVFAKATSESRAEELWPWFVLAALAVLGLELALIAWGGWRA